MKLRPPRQFHCDEPGPVRRRTCAADRLILSLGDSNKLSHASHVILHLPCRVFSASSSVRIGMGGDVQTDWLPALVLSWFSVSFPARNPLPISTLSLILITASQKTPSTKGKNRRRNNPLSPGHIMSPVNIPALNFALWTSQVLYALFVLGISIYGMLARSQIF
jgi:hypothetical protein